MTGGGWGSRLLARASRQQPQKKKWPAFDGLRAVAILAVMAYHLDDKRFQRGGYVGVDVFFVLSGFLITWLLLSEHDRSGTVNFRAFYLRRVLRLAPALVTVIIVVVIVILTDHGLSDLRHLTLFGLPFVIVYSGNWVLVFKNYIGLGVLGDTWSLAVEEQFYIVWPMTLKRLLRRFGREQIALMLLALAGAEILARAALDYSGVGWYRAYFSTFTHSDGLLVGAAIALGWGWLEAQPWWELVRARRTWISASALVCLVAVFAFAGSQTEAMPVWITVSVLLAAVLLVTTIDESKGWANRLLESRPMQWIGVRSYGLYLWHTPLYTLCATLSFVNTSGRTEQDIICVAAAFVAAGLSYRFVERRFLVMKDRFAVLAGT